MKYHDHDLSGDRWNHSYSCNHAQVTHQARHALGPTAETGSRLDQRTVTQGTAGAMRAGKERGKREEKKGRKRKKGKGRKDRQVEAGHRGAIPPSGAFDSTPFCHLSKARGYGHQVGYVTYGGWTDLSHGSGLRRDLLWVEMWKLDI